MKYNKFVLMDVADWERAKADGRLLVDDEQGCFAMKYYPNSLWIVVECATPLERCDVCGVYAGPRAIQYFWPPNEPAAVRAFGRNRYRDAVRPHLIKLMCSRCRRNAAQWWRRVVANVEDVLTVEEMANTLKRMCHHAVA